jgi:hypothetical protein
MVIEKELGSYKSGNTVSFDFTITFNSKIKNVSTSCSCTLADYSLVNSIPTENKYTYEFKGTISTKNKPTKKAFKFITIFFNNEEKQLIKLNYSLHE